MRARAAAAGVLLLELGFACAAHRPPELIPSRFRSSRPGPPINVWLSAERAVDGAGKMKWRALGPSSVARWTADLHRADFSAKRAETPGELIGPVAPEDCQSFVGGDSEIRNNASFREVQRKARASFVGFVEKSAIGFFYGAPATLLEVRPVRWLKTDGARRPPGAFLVPFRVAHFHIGDNLFCAGPPDESAPQPGARVVLFVSPDSPTDHLPMVIPGRAEFFAEGADGGLLIETPVGFTGPIEGQPCEPPGSDSFGLEHIRSFEQLLREIGPDTSARALFGATALDKEFP